MLVKKWNATREYPAPFYIVRMEFPEAVTEVVKKTGTAGAATALAAYLFS